MHTLTSFLQSNAGEKRSFASRNAWTGAISSDWNCASNWSKKKVPAWKDVVIVPYNETGTYPIIDSPIIDFAQLIIEAGAKLTIARGGSITVDGMLTYESGIYNNGIFINQGELNVLNAGKHNIINDYLWMNEGSTAIDKEVVHGVVHTEESTFVNSGEIIELVMVV